MNNTMLHMKLNSAVSVFSIAAAFAVFLPPSFTPSALAAQPSLQIPSEQRGLLSIELPADASAARLAGICFLPDCIDEDVVQGDINMNINSDTEYCEEKGYTYYSSGECPQYQAKVGTCSRDDHYLKCDAVTWCKNNGYNTQTCSLPSFVNDQCPNGKPYYKGCKEDRPRACREQGYVNSCSPGRLYKSTNRCPWDSSYGKCCTASPSTGCPTDYKVTCDPSRGSSGTDTCGYTCYRCCDDNCPSGTSKNYSGSISTYTECGTACKRCKDCTSGSRSYSGSYVGSSECGSCYACSDTCRSGQKSVSCSSNYVKTRVSTTECGTACYSCQYNSACSVTSKSCSYGCASYNSCNKCTSCKSAPACNHGTHKTCSNGCASTCPCCSACTSCKSSSSGSGSTCDKYKSCSTKCTGVTNTKAHCQTTFAPKYYVICNLKITRDWVNCSGQSKTSSGTAYDRRGEYSTQAACEAAAAKTTCSCSSFTWPYCCSKRAADNCNAF